MKFFKLFFVVAAVTAFFLSCSKTDGTIGVSAGTLKSNDSTGDCLPVVIHGTYKAGIPLISTDNYIDVTVNIKSVGTYTITTDSSNGMIFKGTGRLGYTGINRVRLYGTGKPILSGLTTFTVTYNGTSCTVAMIVQSSSSGSFTLVDSAKLALSPAVVTGIYAAGTALNSSDSVVMQVNVSKAGSIYVSSNTVNGISFSGSAIFTSTGIQSITLVGSGIPQSAGTYNFAALDSLSDSSKFTVTVVPFGGGSPALFSLAGNPGGCSGFIEYGTYGAGIKVNAADSVTTVVNVTKPGPYSIVTAPVNGVVFSTTGTFDSIGIYTVALKGSGMPVASGSFNYTAKTDSSSCIFSVSYGQGRAVYALGGSPDACTGFVLNGSYKTTQGLTTDNTVTMQVNVTTTGTYVIATPTIDGITFTATGTFGTTGPQLITLTGTGTPEAPGTFNFPVTAPSGNCLFTINVQSMFAGFSLVNQAYGTCNGFKLSGKYIAGTALSVSDSATVQVNVTDLGLYSLATDTTDGMIFKTSGTFTQLGPQLVTLHGSGKPTAAGGFNLTAIGGGTNCTFSINVAATGTATPAVYTLGKTALDSCSGFSVAGAYVAGKVLTAANTASVQVTVTTAGTYSIKTVAVNGITFSNTGTFTATGLQTVTLTGSGTATAAGIFNYTATAGTSTCIFSVTTVP